MPMSSLKRRLMSNGSCGGPVTRRNDTLLGTDSERDDYVQALRDLTGASKKVARRVAEAYPYGRGIQDATVKKLEAIGMTAAQAKRLLCAFGLVQMCERESPRWRARVQSPRAAITEIVKAIHRKIGHQNQEFFVVVLLNARQNIIDILGTAVGTLSRVDVHPRDLFKHAIQSGAHSILIAHNHPSDETSPSEADVALTERIVRAGKLMGVPVLDSLIVTPSGGYFSFAEHGMIDD